MLKTYLYLKDDNLVKQLWAMAQQEEISRAEMLRQAVSRGLEAIRKQKSSSAQTLLDLAKLGEKHKFKGPKDSSTRIDELLWSKDWSKSE